MAKVSIITPTFNREAFHPRIFACVRAQTYAGLEWLVLDDSAEPSKFLATLDHPGLFYRHLAQRLSIGAKRNALIEEATGEIVVQFDDDDFYAPDYVATVVAKLQNETLDFINLRGWFLLDRRNDFFGYWNLLEKGGLHLRCGREGIQPVALRPRGDDANHLGWGFGFAFRRRVWEKRPFADMNWNEDLDFAVKAQSDFKTAGLVDTTGLCLHVLHDDNASAAFPQYRLPSFLLKTFFPTYGDE